MEGNVLNKSLSMYENGDKKIYIADIKNPPYKEISKILNCDEKSVKNFINKMIEEKGIKNKEEYRATWRNYFFTLKDSIIEFRKNREDYFTIMSKFTMSEELTKKIISDEDDPEILYSFNIKNQLSSPQMPKFLKNIIDRLINSPKEECSLICKNYLIEKTKDGIINIRKLKKIFYDDITYYMGK